MSDIPARDIGTWLRDRRERSGLSLRQIADATKFSVPTLQALERNRVDQLPGGIYRRSIVRSYALQIGLDPEKTLKAFLTEHPQDPATLPHVEPPAAPVSSRRVMRACLSVVAAITGAVISVSTVTQASRREAGGRHSRPGSRATTTSAG